MILFIIGLTEASSFDSLKDEKDINQIAFKKDYK